MVLGKDNIELLPPPVGTSEWTRFSRTSYCVGKMLILKDFIDFESTIAPFTRPRCFGKTTMLKVIGGVPPFLWKTEGGSSDCRQAAVRVTVRKMDAANDTWDSGEVATDLATGLLAPSGWKVLEWIFCPVRDGYAFVIFHDGENTTEIEGTNNWMNRLVGDAALPPEARTTKSNLRLEPGGAGAFNDFSGYRAGDRLQPSGLRGSVELVVGTEAR